MTSGIPFNLLAYKGEMAERIRSFDWASTPLGSMDQWSPALQTTIRILLANRFPHILWWGPRYIQFYNDAYRPIPGSKHPEKALGRPASECWAEIWHVIGPLINRPYNGGPATWDEDICLEINRHGFTEECHFTIAYSPVPDETVPSGIGGVLATVHEITGKVVGDRRVMALSDLGAQAADARTAEEACTLAASTLTKYDKDIPFALLYLIDSDRKHARLAGAANMGIFGKAGAVVVDLEGSRSLPFPLMDVIRSESIELVSGLGNRLGDNLPPGPWSDPPNSAALVPIRSNRAHQLAGFLISGISARLQYNQRYRDFLELVAAQIATSIANAREYEEEKRRAEALAEIDRAKTIFFSNVSHEFRTPLTLMLGPVEDLLARSHTGLSPAAKGQLEVVSRNGLRLLRLVNTLLDFSRIEAGRVQAVFEPTELGAFTSELASNFRAATERAGLKLIVDCPRLPEDVFVDRDLWEKVVLNLISNAFKFTFEGEIEVSLRAGTETDNASAAAVLRVRDTGVGIPAEEMPRLFERFHRVPNTRSRTYEGSGIGLALVQELVKLHGGTVQAESRVGQGTTFAVSIPLGKDHLPHERIGAHRHLSSTALGAAPFVEEALQWLPEDPALGEEVDPVSREELIQVPSRCGTEVNRQCVLVADDNSDMRQYLARLLGERYRVICVQNGQAALAVAQRERPDLILTDVMMPILDGIGLVRELRANPELSSIPIILLSARAGEESRVEGLQHGADDYMIKPFSARELLARVAAHLEMARMRRQVAEETQKSERQLLHAQQIANVGSWYRNLATGSIKWSEQLYRQFGVEPGEFIPTEDAIIERIHPDDRVKHGAAIAEAYKSGSLEVELRILRPDGTIRVLHSRGEVERSPDGKPVAITGVSADVTERKQTENDLRDSEERFRAIFESTSDCILVWDREYNYLYANQAAIDHVGTTRDKVIGKNIRDGLGHIPEFMRLWMERVDRAFATGESFRVEDAFPVGDRMVCSESQISPIRDIEGRVFAVGVVYRDTTARKQVEEELRRSEARYRMLHQSMRDAFVSVDMDGRIMESNQLFCEMLGYSQEEICTLTYKDVTPEQWHSYEEEIVCNQIIARGYSDVYEKEYRRKDGTVIPVELRSILSRDSEGKKIGMWAIVRDISERKKAENELHKLNENLEQLVWERTKKLRRLASELTLVEQRERKQLGRILHDGLQQYLVAAKIQVNGIASAADDEELRASTFEIENILSDALKVSRGLAAELSPPILQDGGIVPALEWLSRWVNNKLGLTVKMVSHIEHPNLAEDVKVLLFESVRELLLNVVKHSGVKEAEIRLCQTHDNRLQVTVADKGKGFDPAQLNACLIPDNGGFGVFSIRERIQFMSGSFEADSTIGKGARFTLIVPMANVEAQEIGPSENAPQCSATPISKEGEARILLVDDHVVMREGLARLLSQEPDMKIIGQAVDGQEAVEMVRDLMPDIILLDVSMPRLNGIDAARIIHQRHPAVQIIGLSLYSEDERAQEMIQAGASRYLSKAGPPSELKATIRECYAQKYSLKCIV